MYVLILFLVWALRSLPSYFYATFILLNILHNLFFIAFRIKLDSIKERLYVVIDLFLCVELLHSLFRGVLVHQEDLIALPPFFGAIVMLRTLVHACSLFTLSAVFALRTVETIYLLELAWILLEPDLVWF